MADPAKVVILPWEERRRKYREGCREAPCGSAMRLDPACAVCANESRIRKARRQGLKRIQDRK